MAKATTHPAIATRIVTRRGFGLSIVQVLSLDVSFLVMASWSQPSSPYATTKNENEVVNQRLSGSLAIHHAFNMTEQTQTHSPCDLAQPPESR
jgi:hypothetical protein